MARAVFEGVALEHRIHVDALLKGRPRPAAVRFAGGAARSAPWVAIFAATLDMPVETSIANELGALGAAIIAATGAGLHPDLQTAVDRMARVCAPVQPDPRHVDRLNRRFAAYRNLRDALDPLWDRL
jgi:L-xylulokinase